MADLKSHKGDLTIRDLYPHLNEEQLKEAEENFKRYIELSIRMYRRIQADPEAYARFKALTALGQPPTIRDIKSSKPNTPTSQ